MTKNFISLLATLVFATAIQAQAQAQLQYLWFQNATNTSKIDYDSSSNGTVTENFINPRTLGNSNATITKLERNGVNGAFVTFNLSNNLTDISDLEISLLSYIVKQTDRLTDENKKVRVYLKNSQLGSSSIVSEGADITIGQAWQTLSFDFKGASTPNAVDAAGGYDQLIIGFGIGNTSPTPTTYYLDRLLSSIDIDNIKEETTETANQLDYLWYQNATNTSKINYDSSSNGTFTENFTNPIQVGNTNAITSKLVRGGGSGAFVTFNLRNNLTDISDLEISLLSYIVKQTDRLTDENKRVRVYLKNSQLGSSSIVTVSANLTAGQAWETLNFDFKGTSTPNAVVAAGGYDQLVIGFGTGDTAISQTIYYLDKLRSSIDLDSIDNGGNEEGNTDRPAAALAGSWGVRLLVSGGIRSGNADYLAGAEEIVEKLPTAGHIISNLTHPAHGYFYTLRGNNYIDIAKDINEDFVPPQARENVFIDVIKELHEAGKKIILYIATDGPSARGGTPNNAEYKADWENYYLNNSQFTGTNIQKEAQAWRLLIRGFVERFAEMGVDGYWLDHTHQIPGDLGDFYDMLREAHPGAIITSNGILDNGLEDNTTGYYKDADGNEILVDTDGTNEIVGNNAIGNINRDYRVKVYDVTDRYMDFSSGHPTPLSLGAPSNSWAYEEFSFPEIVENPWGKHADNDKQVLKHVWIPIRQTQWTNPNNPIQFNLQTAYRFVRTVTDAGGAFTWGNTASNGQISDDEMDIMVEINRRLSQSPKTGFAAYSRPAGAYLVGEDTRGAKEIEELQLRDTVLYPNPVKDVFQISMEITSANVYSMNGAKVLELEGGQDSYDVSSLEAGFYIVEIKDLEGFTKPIYFAKE